MTKPCHKCLLGENSDIGKHIQEYVLSIPAEEKVTDTEYQRRLDICKNCSHLLDGMCILCGCYVEVRAAKAKQHCVKSVDVW